MSNQEKSMEKFVELCNKTSEFLDDFNIVRPIVRVRFHTKLFNYLMQQIDLESEEKP